MGRGGGAGGGGRGGVGCRVSGGPGSVPGIDGNIALRAEQDEGATIIEWPDGTRDDIAYYADYCPFSPQEAWLEVISAGR